MSVAAPSFIIWAVILCWLGSTTPPTTMAEAWNCMKGIFGYSKHLLKFIIEDRSDLSCLTAKLYILAPRIFAVRSRVSNQIFEAFQYLLTGNRRRHRVATCSTIFGQDAPKLLIRAKTKPQVPKRPLIFHMGGSKGVVNSKKKTFSRIFA